jgi:hypothetical protein
MNLYKLIPNITAVMSVHIAVRNLGSGKTMMVFSQKERKGKSIKCWVSPYVTKRTRMIISERVFDEVLVTTVNFL